jgi:hypothetical protein
MKDYLAIGSSPAEEECVQVGEEGYALRARAECRRYIEALRSKLGPEPEGARLALKGSEHDYGTYYEVVCWFDAEREEAVRYAYDCEGDGPATWEDVEPLPSTRCATCERRRPVDVGAGLCGPCRVAYGQGPVESASASGRGGACEAERELAARPSA